ncbi:hypothetical protein WJX75_004128 [Coccomyxa subellipsoidea]|uniref:RNI-like protein n=1 Tax=Coccomyxa subellipsoidea TaxID=248742 RepID=A0ABR2YGK5_9CHLO
MVGRTEELTKGVARCLPHLSTLRSISLRGNSQMPFPDLLLADMPNLEVLKLRDILPAQLTMPKGFRGLHINVSSSTGADHTVWHQGAFLRISNFDRITNFLDVFGIKMISQKWKDCTYLEISLPIINAGFEELLAAILHSSQQPSQLRYLHL